MNCKNCYHADICARFLFTTVEECKYFKDKEHIVELPCKVGDRVYVIVKGNKFQCSVIAKGEVLTISNKKRNKGFTYHVGAKPENRNWHVANYVDSSFGKTVFLTREEAEKALEELK